jgi:hypothetical protein
MDPEPCRGQGLEFQHPRGSSMPVDTWRGRIWDARTDRKKGI